MKFNLRLVTTTFLALIVSFSFTLAQQAEKLKSIFEPSFGEWKLTDKFQVYDADNLYDYIDGAADSYLSYGFIELLSGLYENSPDNYIKVDLYIHKGLNQAYGIYISERPLIAHYDSVGVQGYQEPGILNCFAGKYYLKLSTHNKSERIDTLLRAIAINITDKLDKNKAFPATLNLFPEVNKNANSERFINSNFLGHEFLSSAFVAKYGKEKKAFQIFIISCSTDDEAKITLSKYLSFTHQEFNGVEGRYILNDPHNGIIQLQWEGSYIWGIVNDNNIKIKEDYLQLVKNRMERH